MKVYTGDDSPFSPFLTILHNVGCVDGVFFFAAQKDSLP